jgi:hypothetical protein
LPDVGCFPHTSHVFDIKSSNPDVPDYYLRIKFKLQSSKYISFSGQNGLILSIPHHIFTYAEKMLFFLSNIGEILSIQRKKTP